MLQFMQKKPQVVECHRYDGTANCREEISQWAKEFVYFETVTGVFFVNTPNGMLPVNPGDYVFKGGPNDYYPVTASFVDKNYDTIL